GVPIIEGEGGHPRKLLSTLEAFHEFAQAHDFVVPGQPAHLRLEACERHMETGCDALAGCAVRHNVVIAQNRPAAAQQTRGSWDSERVQGAVEPGAEYAKSLHLPKRGQASYRPGTREWAFSAPHGAPGVAPNCSARAPGYGVGAPVDGLSQHLYLDAGPVLARHCGTVRFDVLVLNAALRQSLVAVRSLGRRGLQVAAAGT